ncbi:22999_t:CDS:2, partial [Cetraspora pellucida]
LLEIDFEHRWMRFVEFVEPFPKVHRYAIEMLYPTCHSWAVCYTQTHFTASIQSTQRVEGINAIIKREVSHSLTLLYLIDAIQNRLDEEARYARISEQKNMNPSIGLPHIASQYFSGIDSLLKEYLTLHILSLQYNFPLEPEDITENECLEDDYERRQTSLKVLLRTLQREDVEQIWIVTPQGLFPSHFNNHVVILTDGSYLCTCLTLNSKINEEDKDIALLPSIRLCKPNQPSASISTSHVVDFRHLSRFRVDNILTPALQKSVSEKMCWSKGYGLSKKALNLMIRLNCDEKFFDMMEGFISSKTHVLKLANEENNDSESTRPIAESQP